MHGRLLFVAVFTPKSTTPQKAAEYPSVVIPESPQGLSPRCHSGKPEGLIRNPDSRSPIGAEERLRGNERNVASDEHVTRCRNQLSNCTFLGRQSAGEKIAIIGEGLHEGWRCRVERGDDALGIFRNDVKNQ